MRKIELELTNTSRIGNINDAAYLTSTKVPPAAALKEESKSTPAQIAPSKPASSPIDRKFDWYQNASYIFVSYKVTSLEVS
jgi:hypothetical protein